MKDERQDHSNQSAAKDARPANCECDNTHEQNGTCCMPCWGAGFRAVPHRKIGVSVKYELHDDLAAVRTHYNALKASHDRLLEAVRADSHDLQEIRIGIDGLDGDAIEIKRLIELVEGRILAARSAIAQAEALNLQP